MSTIPQPSTYSDCVASLRTSLSLLESSVATIGAGVSDFPRLVSVLKTVRHYELIPQPTLAAAEATLRTEIGPATAALLDRAERQLARQARRLETLKARAELNAGRLSSSANTAAVAAERGRKGAAAAAAAAAAAGGKRTALDGEAALRAKAVRQRKEALRYGVERLELEVLQKERELRVRLEAA
ncbi:hypothetical protein P8C59_009147 [Phyllachora maydis]|uniref:DASH complex subunit SPC19 n=1 Tax=Phyllachora maydis TaxID=1825666 RepID=A0AAD9IE38_9PEZI|nr:hypothetical protein P8C59_009147 [Phyllachora maydis]